MNCPYGNGIASRSLPRAKKRIPPLRSEWRGEGLAMLPSERSEKTEGERGGITKGVIGGVKMRIIPMVIWRVFNSIIKPVMSVIKTGAT